MTSRPDAADAPLPMTVSSMVRPLAVVMVDMEISSWWKLERSGKTGFRSRTGGAGVGAVLQRSGGLNVRERAGIGYKYLRSQRLGQAAVSLAVVRLDHPALSHNGNIAPALFCWYEDCS